MQLRRKIPIAIERHLLDAAIIGLLLVLYLPLLVHWYDGWLHKNISLEHEYFSHGLIGLPFAAYIVWLNHQRWRQLPQSSSAVGLALLLMGAVFWRSGLWNLINLSLPTVLAGLCLWLKGIPGFRLQRFPLLLVLLATPTSVPYLLAPYTLPLQRFIAGTAGFILGQLRINVRVEEISLFVNNRIVEVAPHCAGLKMLFTSLYVGLMLLYWRGNPNSRPKTLVFLGCAALASVIANIIRNTALTFLHGTGQEQLFNWLHEGWGGDLYSACLLVVLIPILIRIEKYFPGENAL